MKYFKALTPNASYLKKISYYITPARCSYNREKNESMSRKLRICQPDLTYHVYSRCLEYREMLNDYHKDIFINVILRAQEKYHFNLIHYTIMNDHFHIIIHTVKGGASISRLMQYIKARMAESYNKRNNRNSPFWNERFKDIIVEHQKNPQAYFYWLVWYLGFNPVRRGYVNKAELYGYTSLLFYINEGYHSPLHMVFHNYFLELGHCFIERVSNFRKWGSSFNMAVFNDSG